MSDPTFGFWTAFEPPGNNEEEIIHTTVTMYMFQRTVLAAVSRFNIL